VYGELLKLLNLYTQRMFDLRVLVQRARPFFHGSGTGSEAGAVGFWRDFLEVIDVSERDAEGWLSGRANAGPEAEIVGRDGEKLIHPLERPRLNIDQLKPHGPSYRKLPKSVSSFLVVGSRSRVLIGFGFVGDQPGMQWTRRALLAGAERPMDLPPHVGVRGSGL
jgi:hypothetical protein